MKNWFFTLLLLAWTVSPALADDTNTPALLKIGTADAAKHYDETLIVTGQVAQITIRPGIVFINLDRPYPDSPFTAVIRGSATNQFSNVKALRGKSVEISGKVTNYHDRPEILLTHSNQVTVVSAPAASGAPGQ